jgi:predicted RNA binding protein YcfA (HicA-like mRNA interferase family)
MPSLRPVSRRERVRKLKSLGFEGPFPGGRHQWMRRGGLRLTIPNPHRGAIDPGLIRRILRQARIW